ncbi:MAG: phenylalanine--tRNA ligase subunit alpha [Clostridia bacterium]|nr:phenylalanine--tRNA ligase subunit alpha [Clostridia bacterium]
MGVKEKISELHERMLSEMASAENRQTLEEIRVHMLGKKGELTALLRSMGQLAPEERPAAGQLINEAREKFTGMIEKRAAEIKVRERELALERETLDVTQPVEKPLIGSKHPINRVMDEMVECFTGLGFEVLEGPEVELDHYNFELMNIPKNHPARDAQDTFYVDDNIVLRTHTSPMQARAMLTRKPPIRVICPGRVYRADEVDATHSPVFHQMEGLVIDKDVNMADLRGTLNAFAERIYGKGITTRFRPSFFPFTEPSTEVDLTCSACHGAGCRICKGTGWIEVLGGGMVNPKVLEMCGIDSSVYSGFAFGIGLERIAMLRYGIKDMRLMYEGDVRFLGQFR